MHPKTAYVLFTSLYALAFSVESASYTPFMHSIGMNFFQIEIANTAFIVAQLLAEIPTGILADTRSRRWSLLMGALISGVGFALYAFAINFAMALIAEVTIGIGFAFVSGCAQAWVTDALIARGEATNVRSVFAIASSFRWGASLVAGVLGAWLGGYVSLRAPWILSALSMMLLYAFVNRFMNSPDGESTEKMNEWGALKESVTFLKRDHALLWVVATVIVAGLAGSINHLWHPYFLEHLDQANLGIVWTIVCIGSILGGLLIGKIPHRPRQEILYSIGSIILIGVSFLGLASTNSLLCALSWILIHDIGRGVIAPVVDAYVQHRIGSGNRATFGSLLSVFRHVGMAIAFMANGLLTFGLPYGAPAVRFAWSVMGVVILILTFVLFLFRPKNGKS